MNKTTKEYAEKLAREHVNENYLEWADPTRKHNGRIDFRSGYLSAVEETGVRDIVAALEAFIGIYHANNRVKNQVGEGWIRNAEQALKKLKQ